MPALRLRDLAAGVRWSRLRVGDRMGGRRLPETDPYGPFKRMLKGTPDKISDLNKARRGVPRTRERSARGSCGSSTGAAWGVRRTCRELPLFPNEENLYRRLRMERDGELAAREMPGRAARMHCSHGEGSAAYAAARSVGGFRMPEKGERRREEEACMPSARSDKCVGLLVDWPSPQPVAVFVHEYNLSINRLFFSRYTGSCGGRREEARWIRLL